MSPLALMALTSLPKFNRSSKMALHPVEAAQCMGALFSKSLHNGLAPCSNKSLENKMENRIKYNTKQIAYELLYYF